VRQGVCSAPRLHRATAELRDDMMDPPQPKKLSNQAFLDLRFLFRIDLWVLIHSS
jgi:hypothetical protein